MIALICCVVLYDAKIKPEDDIGGVGLSGTFTALIQIQKTHTRGRCQFPLAPVDLR